jgi:hypothetical protein
MKNVFLVLISTLLFNCTKDNADNNLGSIVDANKVWYISEFPDYCRSCVRPHKIVLGKDTTIGSAIYKIILDYHGDPIESNCKASIRGYLRETSDQKVYWYVKLFLNPPSDILVYDFNARINDTIDHWIVSKIDTVNIFNVNRKRITLINCLRQEKYWIDGIGNMADILSFGSGTICDYKTGIVMENVGGSGFRLNCVKQGDEFIYKNPAALECWIYKEE